MKTAILVVKDSVKRNTPFSTLTSYKQNVIRMEREAGNNKVDHVDVKNKRPDSTDRYYVLQNGQVIQVPIEAQT